MRRMAIGGLMMVSFASGSWAVQHCPVDAEPMVAVSFSRQITDKAGVSHFASGEIQVSKGGAATLMLTEHACCGKLPHSSISGQIEQSRFQTLKRVLASALPVAGNCSVDSSYQPGDGRSMSGGSDYDVFRDGGALRFHIEHTDAGGPAPVCPPEVRSLEAVVMYMEDGTGIEPCATEGSEAVERPERSAPRAGRDGSSTGFRSREENSRRPSGRPPGSN